MSNSLPWSLHSRISIRCHYHSFLFLYLCPLQWHKFHPPFSFSSFCVPAKQSFPRSFIPSPFLSLLFSPSMKHPLQFQGDSSLLLSLSPSLSLICFRLFGSWSPATVTKNTSSIIGHWKHTRIGDQTRRKWWEEERLILELNQVNKISINFQIGFNWNCIRTQRSDTGSLLDKSTRMLLGLYPDGLLEHKQLIKLTQHKYSSGGSTLLDPCMQIFWNWFVQKLPMWIAPNALTVTGLIINVLTTIILIYYSPDGRQEVRYNIPNWYIFL